MPPPAVGGIEQHPLHRAHPCGDESASAKVSNPLSRSNATQNKHGRCFTCLAPTQPGACTVSSRVPQEETWLHACICSSAPSRLITSAQTDSSAASKHWLSQFQSPQYYTLLVSDGVPTQTVQLHHPRKHKQLGECFSHAQQSHQSCRDGLQPHMLHSTLYA